MKKDKNIEIFQVILNIKLIINILIQELNKIKELKMMSEIF